MLVKLPKEVGKVMTRLQEAGFEAYVVGECVRDSILGRKPFGWDVTTNATLEDLKTVFPEAEVFSEKFGVIRLEYIEEAKIDARILLEYVCKTDRNALFLKGDAEVSCEDEEEYFEMIFKYAKDYRNEFFG